MIINNIKPIATKVFSVAIVAVVLGGTVYAVSCAVIPIILDIGGNIFSSILYPARFMFVEVIKVVFDVLYLFLKTIELLAYIL